MLNVSFSGSIVIVVILFLRLMLRNVPKKYICLLWLLALLRLLTPFEIESSFSLQPRVEPVTESQWAELEDYGHVLEPEAYVDTGQTVMPEVPVTEIPYMTESAPVEVDVTYSINWWILLPYLWLAGVAAMTLYTAASYLKLCHRVADSVILSEGVWVSGKQDSAFVLGFLRPQIYLSASLSAQERELVLLHERCHIRRGDHLWKLLGFFALAIHWFNPLVWTAYLLLCRDMEMACDEAVVRDMDVSRRKEYSAALLSCSVKNRAIAACPVAFGEVSVKRRINKVLNYRRPGVWMILIAVIAIAVVAVCFLTTPTEVTPLTIWDIRDVKDLAVLSDVGIYCPGTEKEIAAVMEGLGGIRVIPEPMVEEMPEYGFSIEMDCIAQVDEVCFTADFTQVWGMREGEPTAVYAVENPDAVKDLKEMSYDGMIARQTSAEPFATEEDPVAWVQGISMDAVQKAVIRRVRRQDTVGKQIAGSIMTVSKFEELIPLLNALSEENFVAVEIAHRIYPETQFTSVLGQIDGLCIMILDGSNQLCAYLRLNKESIRPDSEDRIELFLTSDLEKAAADPHYPELQCWIIEDTELLSCLQEMRENPSYIWYSAPYLEQLVP